MYNNDQYRFHINLRCFSLSLTLKGKFITNESNFAKHQNVYGNNDDWRSVLVCYLHFNNQTRVQRQDVWNAHGSIMCKYFMGGDLFIFDST
jgi:hypothetical protein